MSAVLSEVSEEEFMALFINSREAVPAKFSVEVKEKPEGSI